MARPQDTLLFTSNVDAAQLMTSSTRSLAHTAVSRKRRGYEKCAAEAFDVDKAIEVKFHSFACFLALALRISFWSDVSHLIDKQLAIHEC